MKHEIVDLEKVSNHEVEVIDVFAVGPVLPEGSCGCVGNERGRARGWAPVPLEDRTPRPWWDRGPDVPREVRPLLRPESPLMTFAGTPPVVIAFEQELAPCGLQLRVDHRIPCASGTARVSGRWTYARASETTVRQRLAGVALGWTPEAAVGFVDQLDADPPQLAHHRWRLGRIDLTAPTHPTADVSTVLEPAPGERLRIHAGESTWAYTAAGLPRALFAAHVRRLGVGEPEPLAPGLGGEIWIGEIGRAAPGAAARVDLEAQEELTSHAIAPGIVAGPWDVDSAVLAFATRASARVARAALHVSRIERRAGGWRVATRSGPLLLDGILATNTAPHSNIACAVDPVRRIYTVAVVSLEYVMWLAHFDERGALVRGPYLLAEHAEEMAHSNVVLSYCERTDRYLLQTAHNLWYLARQASGEYRCFGADHAVASCEPMSPALDVFAAPIPDLGAAAGRVSRTNDGFASAAATRAPWEFYMAATRISAPHTGVAFASFVDEAGEAAGVALVRGSTYAEERDLPYLPRAARVASRLVPVPAPGLMLVLSHAELPIAETSFVCLAEPRDGLRFPPRPAHSVRFSVIREA